MKHLKSIDQFINEQLFGDAEAFKKFFMASGESGSTGASPGSNVEVKSERNDENACPNYDCWTHFGKEAFWNGSSKINGKPVPKIVISKTPMLFSISYEGTSSGFLLKHAKGGKGDTIHQLLNVLTLELNEYLKTITAKPDVANIKMNLTTNKLTVDVPLKATAGDHYTIARRGGLGHGGDFTGLMKYKGKKGYEEAKHKSGSLTEKFVTYISD